MEIKDIISRIGVKEELPDFTYEEHLDTLRGVLNAINPYETDHEEIMEIDEYSRPSDPTWWLEQMKLPKRLWNYWMDTPTYSSMIHKTLMDMSKNDYIQASITRSKGIKGELRIPDSMKLTLSNEFVNYKDDSAVRRETVELYRDDDSLKKLLAEVGITKK